jgi:hypothetical protein
MNGMADSEVGFRRVSATGDESKILRLEALRKLVSEKFPESRAAMVPEESIEFEGFPRGLLTEIHGSAGSISLFLLSALLQEKLTFAGLVDATNAFEPGEFPPSVLRRLLWVRCREAAQAVHAVDLLLRDGNLPLVFLDLRGVPPLALRQIPASTWHRFQRLLEEAPLALAVCTGRPCIAPARLRIEVSGSWTLRDMIRPRQELLGRLHARTLHRGGMPSAEERRIA